MLLVVGEIAVVLVAISPSVTPRAMSHTVDEVTFVDITGGANVSSLPTHLAAFECALILVAGLGPEEGSFAMHDILSEGAFIPVAVGPGENTGPRHDILGEGPLVTIA